jgi:Tol biopolymer transport system component
MEEGSGEQEANPSRFPFEGKGEAMFSPLERGVRGDLGVNNFREKGGSSMRAKAYVVVVMVLAFILGVNIGSVWADSLGKIVFDRDWDIWIMDDDGTNQMNLTNTPGVYEGKASFSPDGTQIAYGSGRYLYTMNSDGTGKTLIYTSPYSIADVSQIEAPAWSPDGSKLVFRDGQYNLFDLYLISTDGSGLQNLTGDHMHNQFASWSPDGSQIVYTRRDVAGSSYSTKIWRMDADGSNKVQLTFGGSSSNYSVYDYPDWSPDGTKILYVNNYFDLYLMNPDGSNQAVIMVTPQIEYSPSWSPDGSQIVFDTSTGIWRMDANGTNLV